MLSVSLSVHCHLYVRHNITSKDYLELANRISTSNRMVSSAINDEW